MQSRPRTFRPMKQSKSSRLKMFFEIGSLKNFAIFTGKHLYLSLFLIKLKACKFFKKRLQHRCFLWVLQNFQEQLFYRTPKYSKGSWGVYSLISRLHMLSIYIVQIIHLTKPFLLAWIIKFHVSIDWYRAFNFRICFRKTLAFFDCDQKLTQSVTQITM